MAQSVSAFSYCKDADKWLGSGFSGSVYEKVFNNLKVAVKRIDRNNLCVLSDREVDTMKQLCHPNILRLLHIEEDDEFKYLVLELCSGTVRDYLNCVNNSPRENDLSSNVLTNMPCDREALLQMAIGLQYIHSNHLVHRDIKAENVLIYESTGDNRVLLKISDFGFSKPVSQRGSFSVSQVRGTKYMLAPELMEMVEEDRPDAGNNEAQKPRATVACDIFSMGCLFFKYLTRGGHPFLNGKTSYYIELHIMTGVHDLSGLSEEHSFARDTIKRMISLNPCDRPNIDQVIHDLQI